MKMKYVTVKSGLESVDGAYLGQFVSNGTRFLDDIAAAMCVDRPAVDEPEARLAIRALAAEIREQVGEKLCRVNAGAVSFEPAISGSLPAMDAPLSEENELYVNIIASDALRRAIGELVPTRDSSSAIKVVIDNVEDLASHDRVIVGTREFVVTGYNLSARLEGEGLSLAEDDGTPAAAVTVKAEDGMGQRINAQLAAAVPAGDYRLQLTTHGYSTPDADVETYTKKVKVEATDEPMPMEPKISRVTSAEGEDVIKVGVAMTIEGVGFDKVARVAVQYISTGGSSESAMCTHTVVDATTITVAAVPALPNIDVSSPAEVDIIDAEGVVLDYYEVTVVA